MGLRIRTEADRICHPLIAVESLESAVFNLHLSRKHGIALPYECKRRLDRLLVEFKEELLNLPVEEPIQHYSI